MTVDNSESIVNGFQHRHNRIGSARRRSNQLVIIGRELDHELLRKQLQACVAPDAGKGFG